MRTKKQQKNSNIGKHLKCKFCEYPDATIIEREIRYMVDCLQCGASYYLKEQHIATNLTQVENQLTLNL